MVASEVKGDSLRAAPYAPPPCNLVHLSTAAASNAAPRPWVNIQSAGWVRFQSAPTLYRLNLVGQQFLGTRDADDIQRRIGSCTSLISLLAELDNVSGAADAIAHLLNITYAASAPQRTATSSLEEDDELAHENEWLRDCVLGYIATREALAEQGSRVWTVAALEELAALQGKPDQLAEQGIPDKFSTLPAQLSSDDRAQIAVKLDALLMTRAQAIEQARAAKAAAWVAQFQGQQASVSTMSKGACSALLSALQACPSDVSPDEFAQLADLKTGVERRHDELDISDLVNRISAMSPEKRAQLLQQLRTLEEAAA